FDWRNRTSASARRIFGPARSRYQFHNIPMLHPVSALSSSCWTHYAMFLACRVRLSAEIFHWQAATELSTRGAIATFRQSKNGRMAHLTTLHRHILRLGEFHSSPAVISTSTT